MCFWKRLFVNGNESAAFQANPISRTLMTSKKCHWNRFPAKHLHLAHIEIDAPAKYECAGTLFECKTLPQRPNERTTEQVIQLSSAAASACAADAKVRSSELCMCSLREGGRPKALGDARRGRRRRMA